jgi:hypothetical protein
MLRWPIIRTLLYKEILRYRYNWGLVVMAVALLALAALISVSARLGKLPGQEGPALDWCRIYYTSAGNSQTAKLVDHLVNHTTPPGEVRTVNLAPRTNPPTPEEFVSFAPNTILLLIDPPSEREPPSRGGGVWTGRFLHYGSEPPPAMAAYRAWFLRETQRFLNSQPRVEEELHGRKPPSGIEVTDRIPLIETALILFALYLMAFNIYLTSTGEERDKRILLALLLTPARPGEIIAAKGIFYGSGSLILAVAILAMCHPAYLTVAAFWPAVTLGAFAYLAIATVLLSLIRRQTTITTVSMLYLIGTTVIMILGDILPPFLVLRFMLIEHYLHTLIYQIMSNQRGYYFGVNLLALMFLTFVWSGIAVFMFSRKGIAISQGR